MHAASVHPEPGSNSRTNCISTVSGQHQVCRACGSFYFLSMHPVLSGCVSKNDEIFALASFLLVLKSPVVQLSMINRGFDSVLAFPLPVSPRLSRGQLIYYTTFASTCQEVFKTFFKKFFACRSGGVCSSPSARLADYITFPAACQGGGEDFFRGLDRVVAGLPCL